MATVPVIVTPASRDLLLTQQGPQATLYLGTKDPFSANPYDTYVNHTITVQDIQSNMSPNWGTRICFEIQKCASKLGPLELVLNLGPLTVTPAGSGPYSRFVDYLGQMFFQDIRIMYGSQELNCIVPDVAHIKQRMDLRPEQQNAEIPLILGPRSVTDRNADALLTNEIVFQIPTYWTDDIRKWPNISALAARLTVQVTLRPLANIIQTNGTNPACTINSLVLRETLAYLPRPDENRIRQQTMAKNGIQFPFLYNEYQLGNLVPTGATSCSISLENIKGAVSYFIFLIRDTASQSVPLQYDYTGLQVSAGAVLLNTMSVTAANLTIVPVVSRDYILSKVNPRFYRAGFGGFLNNAGANRDNGNDFYGWPFALDPADRYNPTGFQVFATLSRPTLNLTFTSALTQEATVDIYAFSWNHIIHTGVDIKKLFTGG